MQGRCSAAEAAAVEVYLDKHPDALEKYWSEADWQRFDTGQALDPGMSEQYWQRIADATATPVRVLPFAWQKIAAAVSVLLVLGLSWLVLFNRHVFSSGPQQDTASPMQVVFNNTKEAMLVRLSDSSEVELMPNSGLSYPSQFGAVERAVSFKGAAIFHIRKNPDRVFRVHTDSLVTEVLGTRFTIHAFETDRRIQVVLHEGRVRMRSTGRPFAGNLMEYILQPGDTFSFDKQNRQVNIRGIRTAPDEKTTGGATPSAAGKSGRAGDNWYMFNNQALSGVLEQLQLIYNTPIHYRKEDLRGMSFIGKIDKADSLESILTTITLLNQLQLVKEEKGYTIRK